MATSGTTAFNLDLAEAIEEAYERCGSEARSGYDFRTARRSLNLMFADWANRGLNMWTFEEVVLPLVAGTDTYTLAADTVDMLDAVVRTGVGVTQADITITRISFSEYQAIPNKTITGRPIQMLLRREAQAPRLTVWPVPDNVQAYSLVYWRLRRVQDAGDGVNTQDLPFRFLPCMIAGLAYYLSMKVPGALDRMQMLKAQYDEAWQLASDEDREKADIRIVPRIC